MRALWAMALCAILTFAVPAASVWGQTADPLNGTWQLNLSKSKFVSGPNAYRGMQSGFLLQQAIGQALDQQRAFDPERTLIIEQCPPELLQTGVYGRKYLE